MKILYVTTISLTMNTFFKPHIKMLVDEGNQVDIACNYKDLSLADLYKELGCNFYQIDFSRSPLSKNNIKAFCQLKKVIKNGGHDIVHCHTPNASVVTRLVCRKFRKKNGLKVFYTAHGFHFYKGAPKLNWMVYYPIEKFCSKYTDKLITINKEDYELAKTKFKANEVHYIPGVGIDLSKFENIHADKKAKRQELGIPDNSFLLISVGELSKRKNHILVLQALAKIDNDNIHYVIVGKGDLLSELQDYVDANNLTHRVHFLGFRSDIPELYSISDLCCFPSIHEGLPVALMEALACGLPVVAAKIRGTSEFVVPDKNGFLCKPEDVGSFVSAIYRLMTERDLRARFVDFAPGSVNRFDLKNILEMMRSIYEYHL